MLNSKLDQMRSDLKEWTDFEIGHGWMTSAEAADIGRAMDKAVNSGNAELISCWADWLHHQVEFVREMKAKVRQSYVRLRESIDAEKKAKAA